MAVKNARSTIGHAAAIRSQRSCHFAEWATMRETRMNHPGFCSRQNGTTRERGGDVAGQDTRIGVDNKSAKWVRRAETAAFSPAPGIQVQPIVGEAMMTCWIAMEPGAVVAEHNHANEQLGVVVEGSVTLTCGDDTRTVAHGEGYVIPSDLPHHAVAGENGALLVETFAPVREDYVRAWRAAGGA
jgi:quercetin dioxygenase-like cupin family protein